MMPTAMVAPISAHKIRSWYKKHKSLESHRLIDTMRTRSISGTDVHSKAILLIFLTAHSPFPEKISPTTHAILQVNWYFIYYQDFHIAIRTAKNSAKEIRPLTEYIYIERERRFAGSNESL